VISAASIYSCVDVSVQRLVEHGIPLETENKEKETACDCAEKNGHNDIALFLESKMVFSSVCPSVTAHLM